MYSKHHLTGLVNGVLVDINLFFLRKDLEGIIRFFLETKRIFQLFDKGFGSYHGFL